MTTLRDYQSAAVDSLRSSLAQGHRASCFVLLTGSGTTHLAAHLIRTTISEGNRAVLPPPRREPIYKTSYREICPKPVKDAPAVEPSLETMTWIKSQNVRFAKRASK